MASYFDSRDGGYASRKLWFSVGTAILIAVTGLATARWPGLSGVYPTMVGGLLAALAAYSGANIGAKFVVGNHLTKIGTGTAAAGAMAPDSLEGLGYLPGQPMEQIPPDMEGDPYLGTPYVSPIGGYRPPTQYPLYR